MKKKPENFTEGGAHKCCQCGQDCGTNDFSGRPWRTCLKCHGNIHQECLGAHACTDK